MDACQKSVLKYLTDQNRPYSTNDIVLNMHKVSHILIEYQSRLARKSTFRPLFQEHGKTAIQKALDSLVADGGKVVEKLNGKQKAYVVNQANLPTGMRT